MLHTPAKFPYPGSVAMLDGLRWTILQHKNDGADALLSREGDRASFTRTAPIAELEDAACVDADRDLLHGFSERAARIGLRIASILRDKNEVPLGHLRRQLADEAREGRIPAPHDNFELARLLVRLGWRKSGMIRTAAGSTPNYVRTGLEQAA